MFHRIDWTARLQAVFFLLMFVGGSVVCLATDTVFGRMADGRAIYQQHCLQCHGDNGQGVEDEGTGPLMGDKSVGQLAAYIDESMPLLAPESCVGPDAKRVAQYIYDRFYAPDSQARRQPARMDLVRLTVRQYRNAVADLIGSFRPQPPLNDQQGLEGHYYNQNRPGRQADLTQTATTVDFHFGPAQLPPEPLDPVKGFAARWQGSIIAPETGEYKITVATNQAIRLWLNDSDQTLIDAWVQSGDQTRHTGSVFLLGGRAYPVRLDFTSRQQGVEDRKKYEEQPREMFVELRWQPPDGVEQVIPQRYLAVPRGPELFVSTTPFPPDDRSHGYLRGISASQAWDDATTWAAIEAAGYVIEHLDELAKVSNKTEDREQKLRAFCQEFVARAFRRPLDEQTARIYIQRRFEQAPDLETAVKRVVLMTLKSPRALYLDYSRPQPDGFDVATMLSFALWDSLPDESLRRAAADHQLASRTEIARQADRMVGDPRARAKLRYFLHSWLQMDHGHDLTKNQDKYPDFDEHLVADLRTSLDLFLDEVVWNGDGDFRKLLQSNQMFLNGRLAKFYGYDLPAEAPFQKVQARLDQRTGVVSHPYMMAAFAYTEFSSPIHRGVFLIRNVLGRTLRPPPAAFSPLSPDLHPDMTTRERVAMQTEPDSCQACHKMINPIGFTLEHFDAVGRFRTTENGRSIDASGVYELVSGQQQTFQDAGQLAAFLAGSQQTHRAFALQLFNHLVKQPVRAFGADMDDQMEQAFTEHGYAVPKMMAEIAARAAAVLLDRSANSDTADSHAAGRWHAEHYTVGSN